MLHSSARVVGLRWAVRWCSAACTGVPRRGDTRGFGSAGSAGMPVSIAPGRCGPRAGCRSVTRPRSAACRRAAVQLVVAQQHAAWPRGRPSRCPARWPACRSSCGALSTSMRCTLSCGMKARGSAPSDADVGQQQRQRQPRGAARHLQAHAVRAGVQAADAAAGAEAARLSSKRGPAASRTSNSATFTPCTGRRSGVLAHAEQQAIVQREQPVGEARHLQLAGHARVGRCRTGPARTAGRPGGR
jgi:hypothetical protein